MDCDMNRIHSILRSEKWWNNPSILRNPGWVICLLYVSTFGSNTSSISLSLSVIHYLPGRPCVSAYSTCFHFHQEYVPTLEYLWLSVRSFLDIVTVMEGLLQMRWCTKEQFIVPLITMRNVKSQTWCWVGTYLQLTNSNARVLNNLATLYSLLYFQRFSIFDFISSSF